jgi:hypothetical protein
MLLFGAGLDVYIDFLSNTVILEIGLTDKHSLFSGPTAKTA